MVTEVRIWDVKQQGTFRKLLAYRDGQGEG